MVWACQYCDKEYKTKETAEKHEKMCSEKPTPKKKEASKETPKPKQFEKTCITCGKPLKNAITKYELSGGADFEFRCSECKDKKIEEEYEREAQFQREAEARGLTPDDLEYFTLRREMRGENREEKQEEKQEEEKKLSPLAIILIILLLLFLFIMF